MGRVVTFAHLPGETIAEGVTRAAITARDAREMAAAFVRIAAGKRWTGAAPHGSDCYLFMVNGSAAISAGEGHCRFSSHAFATVEEGVEFTVECDPGGPADIVQVLAPPLPNRRGISGFKGRLSVAERSKTPVVPVAEEKKQRIYFVGHHPGARSERGHAMIVIYQKDTVTALHHHPDAESMFVPLDGALRFSVNGEDVLVGPGQAAYFAIGDKHGLRVAEGHDGASFLEFHIPAAFTTVK